MFRNVASQKLAVFAYDTSSGPPYAGKTGDAANITAEISKDGGTSAGTNDVNPTELDAVDHPGIYLFDLTQAETNADLIVVTPVSATANIELDPVQVFTMPVGFKEGVGAVVVDTIASGYTETSPTLKGGGTATLSAQNDAYNGRVVLFTSGTYAGFAREVSDYDGTTKVLTLSSALPGAPGDGDGFVIL